MSPPKLLIIKSFNETLVFRLILFTFIIPLFSIIVPDSVSIVPGVWLLSVMFKVPLFINNLELLCEILLPAISTVTLTPLGIVVTL